MLLKVSRRFISSLVKNKNTATFSELFFLRVQLVKKARLGKRIQPIQIPKMANKLKDNAKCLVAGWGLTKTGMPVDLQMAEVPLVKMEDCRREWSQEPVKKRLPKDVLCAGGYRTNKGFCQVCLPV